MARLRRFMKNRGTAGTLIESSLTRELIEASLLSLGFSTVAVIPREPSISPSLTLQLSAYDLVITDARSATAVLDAALSLEKSHRLPPPIVLVRDAAPEQEEASDLSFDGVLQLPLSEEEVSLRLRVILHAHHALVQRFPSLLEDLSLAQSVIRSVTNGIVIADAILPDFPIAYVNPAFEKLTGYSLEEVRGRNCRFMQGTDTQQPGLETVRAALQGQHDTLTVIRNYRKDGSRFWNELYLSPIRDAEGRVRHFVGIQNDVTLRVEAEQRLGFLAHHDALTGLANRDLLFERMQQAILRANRQKTSIAVLFFDLDKFKNINDVFGHEAGDCLLRLIASRLIAEVRECDTAARLGGDEFILMLPDLTDTQEVPALIHRISERISQTAISCGHSYNPTFSVGYSLYPRDGSNPEELLKVADFAMYAEKHKRRQAEQEDDARCANQASITDAGEDESRSDSPERRTLRS